ncbi:hypothetical protein [Luteolibacter marinus]|uniref:hypothetical protein n=1 Tax=Luteolibacter marinus TaxID=2776705 RepID=UPI00186668A1|nr:hypothetical protein [Luteolibacter marinus]
MKLQSLAALCAVLLPVATQSIAAADYKVRGVSIQPGVPGVEVHAHLADGSATAGVVNLRQFLNHEFDTLKVEGKKVVFTLNADPASATDPTEEVGSCEFDDKDKSYILMFIPEQTGKPKCRVLSVPDDVKSFPVGSINVVNLTSMPVKIELEKDEFSFKPGETRPIVDPPVAANQTAGMKAYVEKDGAWAKFSSGIWPHPGKKRVLQVFVENPTNGTVQIRGVRDVSEP